MFPIRFKRPALLCMAMLTVVLSGCGLIQKVVDESKAWPQPFSTNKSKYCISISSPAAP